jgi:hypothetical protein
LPSLPPADANPAKIHTKQENYQAQETVLNERKRGFKELTDFDGSDAQATSLEHYSDTTGRHTLSESTDDTSGHQNILHLSRLTLVFRKSVSGDGSGMS